MSQPLTTLVEWKRFRFLIMDAPNDINLDVYIAELKKHGITDVVRVCEPTYDSSRVTAVGIQLHDLPFADGESPPAAVLDTWLDLVDARFKGSNGDGAIAVHCVAGLGRAPVLVAIALIESGLEWEQAVEHIRSKRRGVINAKQLRYLQTYRPTRRPGSCCVLM